MILLCLSACPWYGTGDNTVLFVNLVFIVLWLEETDTDLMFTHIYYVGQTWILPVFCGKQKNTCWLWSGVYIDIIIMSDLELERVTYNVVMCTSASCVTVFYDRDWFFFIWLLSSGA